MMQSWRYWKHCLCDCTNYWLTTNSQFVSSYKATHGRTANRMDRHVDRLCDDTLCMKYRSTVAELDIDVQDQIDRVNNDMFTDPIKSARALVWVWTRCT